MADDITINIPDTPVPALSATSDVPVFEAVPETPVATETVDAAPQPAEAAEPAAEATAVEDTASEAGAEDAQEQAEQAEIADEQPQRREDPRTRRAREQDAAIAALQGDLRKALDAIDRLTTPREPQSEQTRETAPQPPQQPVKPRREDFTDPDAYDDARDQWAVDRAKYDIEADQRARAAEAAAREQNEARVQQAQTTLKAWNDRRSAFIAEHPDYQTVAERSDIQISPAMAQVISTHENGPALAYYLGQNPEIAAKIAQSTGWDGQNPAVGMQSLMRAGVELGMVAARLQSASQPAAPQQPQRQISRAPAPITPLSGTNAEAGERAPEEMSGDEYFNQRIGHYQEMNRAVGRIN